MISPIRVTPLPADTASAPTDPTKRAKPAGPTSASLPKGGGQLENLKALGARGRAAGGKTTPDADGRLLTREPSFSEWARPASPRPGLDADGRRLTREPSFSEWARPASPRTVLDAGDRPLTRDSSSRFSTPSNPPAASKDDDWSALDDIFRRQPTAGQASIGAATHSLIDEPQEPLPEPAHMRPNPAVASKPAPKSSHPTSAAGNKPAASSAHQAPVAGRKPARSGTFGISSAFKRVTNWMGLGRSPSTKPARADSPRPSRAEPRPSAAPHDPVGETVSWIHEQNGRPAEWRNATPKLSVEQARREGKAVPSRPAPPPPMAGAAGRAAHPAVPKLSIEQARREGKAVPSRRPPPPPSMTGSVGHAVRPSTPSVEEDDLMELDIGSGMVSKPRTPEPRAQRDDSGPIATPRRAAKRPVKEGVDYHLPKLGPLSPIPEGQHETGVLASLGQHYGGLWRDLRRSMISADSALKSLPTTRKKGLAAKRAELEHCAAELTRLIDEGGMADADLKTVESLQNLEGPKAPTGPDSLRARAITVGWDIHETKRQSNHARNKLRTLQRAIASIPDSQRA